MWKNSEQAKRQKTAKWAGGQLGGKAAAGSAPGSAPGSAAGAAAGVAAGAAAGAAAAIGEEIIKDKEGEIWDKKALNALFNKIIKYSVINNYIFAITELLYVVIKRQSLTAVIGGKALSNIKEYPP